MEKTIYKLTAKTLGKETKAVKAMEEFIAKNYTVKGACISYKCIAKEFGAWNENEKTVKASSLDLHKVLLTACFYLARRTAEAVNNGKEKDSAVIPCPETVKGGETVVNVRCVSVFEDFYYDIVDGLKQAEEKTGKDTEGATAEGATAEGATAEGATASIIAMIAKYGKALDLVAIRKAIEDASTIDVFGADELTA